MAGDRPAGLRRRRQRDQRGMYKLAESGQLKSFPGVSAAYEAPAHADLTLETDKVSVAECVERVVALLKERGNLSGATISPEGTAPTISTSVIFSDFCCGIIV